MDKVISYNKKRALIEAQMCQSWEYDLAIKPENQKHFPFYCHTNFNTSQILEGGKIKKHNPFTCDYCGEVFDTNFAGYYCAFFIWESAFDLRICCNVFHCRKGKLPLTYSQQATGYSLPVELGRYAESPDHSIVMSVFFSPGSSNVYDLNRFIGKGITVQELTEHYISSSTSGGNRPNGNFYDWWNGHLEWGNKIKKQSKRLSKSDIVRLLNDILLQKKRVFQLELF